MYTFRGTTLHTKESQAIAHAVWLHAEGLGLNAAETQASVDQAILALYRGIAPAGAIASGKREAAKLHFNRAVAADPSESVYERQSRIAFALVVIVVIVILVGIVLTAKPIEYLP